VLAGWSSRLIVTGVPRSVVEVRPCGQVDRLSGSRVRAEAGTLVDHLTKRMAERISMITCENGVEVYLHLGDHSIEVIEYFRISQWPFDALLVSAWLREGLGLRRFFGGHVSLRTGRFCRADAIFDSDVMRRAAACGWRALPQATTHGLDGQSLDGSRKSPANIIRNARITFRPASVRNRIFLFEISASLTMTSGVVEMWGLGKRMVPQSLL